MKFSDRFYRDAENTWAAIASDVAQLDELTNEGDDINFTAWSFILDANRLAAFGSDESEAELHAVLDEDGVFWTDVLQHCAETHPLGY
jgi:hypothetical protein